MLDLPNVFPEFRISDLVDVALVSVLLYGVLQALKLTRTTFVVGGVLLLAGIYVVAIAFDLRLSGFLVQLVGTVALLAVIVMFHQELRSAAARLFSLRFQWRRSGGSFDPFTSAIIETLVTTVRDFARERIGALIVLQGLDDPIQFIRGGFALHGVLSEPLLKSIFDSHSIGHDGAVLLVGNRVERFACHLPLSTDAQKIGKRGTRHAAALGLAEKTDSLSLVVSEERGTISIARHANLEQVDDFGRLSEMLGAFYREIYPTEQKRTWIVGLRRNLGLKAAALLGAMLLWFLVVHQGATEYRSFMVDATPVGQDAVNVAKLDPSRVQVVVSGPRRRFYWVDASNLKVNVPVFNGAAGQNSAFLTATDVELPEGLMFVNVVPRVIRYDVGD